jgi:hypothetical protein
VVSTNTRIASPAGTATGSAAPDARVAVGASFVANTVADVLGVALLVALTVGASLALAAVTFVRRSRNRAWAP